MASSRLSVSLPSCPNISIRLVLATVDGPPLILTAPPLTRRLPAALRLTMILLLLSPPRTVRVAVVGSNVAVIAPDWFPARAGTAVRPTLRRAPDHEGCHDPCDAATYARLPSH